MLEVESRESGIKEKLPPDERLQHDPPKTLLHHSGTEVRNFGAPEEHNETHSIRKYNETTTYLAGF